MKKKLVSSIMILLLAFVFSFSACGINGNDAANESGGTSNGNPRTDATDRDENNKNNENNDGTLSTDIITDWESVGIFAVNVPEYEFDFSINDTEYTYETGSAEDEALFASILSGKTNYKKYFGWFCANPAYIYRFNEECYKAVAETIREGAFTKELRDKYFGLVVTDTNYSYLSALGVETESYQIFFEEDWSIKYINKSIQYNVRCNAFERWHYSLIGYSFGKDFSAELNGELVQYDRIIKPNYEEQCLIGYRITQDSLLLSVNMGNGKTADCIVAATYHFELDTEFVWNGQKQQHEQVTYLSCCTITADFNKVYSGGYEMFDRILIYAQQSGLWNLFRVWEQCREEVLTPSLNLYETNEQKIYQLA